jgi:predicted NAD/FAD-dependent oxidoreductase
VAAYFEGRGGRLLRGARAESLVTRGGRVVGVRYRKRPDARDAIAAGEAGSVHVEPVDAVVSAVPPPALVDLLPEGERESPGFEPLQRFSGSPIVSVDLWLDRVVVDRVMLGLRDCEMEWVFDKGRLCGREGAPQHLAFIVSAAYRSAPKPNAELVEAAVSALRRFFPGMAEAAVTRSLVQREPQATFASTPELDALRPGPQTRLPGLFLAGDWTATGLPATIEGAVRSGLHAADAVERAVLARA